MTAKSPTSVTDRAIKDLNLPERIVGVMTELGLTNLTEIQAKTIPLLIAGRDVIGQSRTGSGKTMAFAVPLLKKIQLEPRVVQALVLCPTRELCAQVAREIRKFGRKFPGLQVLIVSGGQTIAPQIGALEKGAHIAVGTPGRVLDLIQRKKLILTKAKTLVLDEADRMLDMGFQEDMEAILGALPRQCQTAFFSATFPESIDELSRKYQSNPVKVVVEDPTDEKADIREFFYRADEGRKFDTLSNIIGHYQPGTSIVFVNLKAVAREVAEELQASGISSASLHGDLLQFERDEVMARFRNRSLQVLVATDVAARGIDVDSLDLVVNYDCPGKPDVYVHRIGRTGRAGKSGTAATIFLEREQHKLDFIKDYTGRTPKIVKLDTPIKSATKPAAKPKTDSGQMVTLAISGGRKDKLRPGDILGALTGEAAGLDASDVGKIEIHDRIAYVAIRKSVAVHALKSLETGKIKARTFRVRILD